MLFESTNQDSDNHFAMPDDATKFELRQLDMLLLSHLHHHEIISV